MANPGANPNYKEPPGAAICWILILNWKSREEHRLSDFGTSAMHCSTMHARRGNVQVW